MYLVDEIDSLVVFPQDNGKFRDDQVKIGNTYEVHGTTSVPQDTTRGFPPQTSSRGFPVQAPFGAYTQPSFCNNLPPPHPPRSSKCSKIKKTLEVVTLYKKGKSKKGKLEYTTVTQVVVSMTPAECTVSNATQVSEQVGFEVILLDSKCFPLMKNESTSGIDFWKSTRKILAASASLWEKLSGLTLDGYLAQTVDLTGDVCGPSQKKAREDNGGTNTSCLVLEKVTTIERKLSFLDELSLGLNCAVCKCIAKVPVVSPCCQRVVGCETCVNNWLSTRDRCPLCNTSGAIANHFALKGFDEAIALKGQEHSTPADEPVTESVEEPVNSDSDFEDLPRFSVAH